MDQAETDILDWLSSGAKTRYEFDDDQIDPLDAMVARGEVCAITEGDGTVIYYLPKRGEAAHGQ